MAESSLFAQRLQAITERRRLQERILATRRELEEERLRAQRLKRKSLRDRWLMEGTSSPTGDNDHMSSVWEAQNRIQALEQDLSSLQSQMQQLDNPELRQGRQQLEEPVKVLKEVQRSSLDGIREVDGISSPEERSNVESRLELAPVPPKRPVRVAAKEKLQNGDMPGVGLFGSECSPEKAGGKVSPLAEESGDFRHQQGSSEAVPDVKPSCQGSDPREAPAGCQRKLAVEEMVIRDHLGQEVGSMDAVGQKQGSIEKKEELEGHPDVENGCEEGSQLSPLCSQERKASEAAKSPVDDELSSRDGPEGESPTSRDRQSLSKPLQDESSCPDSSKCQADGELEVGSLAEEVVLMGEKQKDLPGAKEEEPAQDLVVPCSEPVMQGEENPVRIQGLQEFHGSEAAMPGPGGEPKPPLLDQIPPLEETKRQLLDPVLPSPALSDQIPLTLQGQIPSLQDQIPSSFQETEGSILEPMSSLLSNQSPSTLLDQISPLQESKGSLPVSIPSSQQQESLLDPKPPSLQDQLSSSLEQKSSSLQGEITPVQDQISTPLCEANDQLLDQNSTSLQEQNASLPDQVQPPLLGEFTSFPGQVHSSLHETERSLQISTTLQDQEFSVQEAKGSFPDIVPSLSNQLSSVPEKIMSPQEGEGLSSSEKIPVTLQDQMPTPLEAQIPSLPEADIILLGQKDKHLLPGEPLTSVLDQITPALQDQNPTFLERTTPSLQEVEGPPTDQSQASLPSQASPGLLEVQGSLPNQAQPIQVEQNPTSLQGKGFSPQEAEQLLPEKQTPSLLLEEMPKLPGQAPSPNNVQRPMLQDTTATLSSSSQELGQPPMNSNAIMENQAPKESGNASLATVTEETKEVLESLQAEQQPLLEESKASAAALDISLGDSQPKAGVLKLEAASRQETPTYTITSANTASSCQLQPATSHPGEDQDQEQSQRKQKSCQCCSVM